MKKNCDNCIKQHTTNCPNSYECYNFEDKPHFEPKKEKEKKDLFPLFLYIMGVLGFIALVMACLSNFI